MRCDFRPTGETNARGLPKLRCSRAGCANVCFTDHPPAKIRFRCKHPTLVELGELTAATIKVVTLGRVRERPGCGCARRRKKLNERFSLPVPNFIVRWWRRLRENKIPITSAKSQTKLNDQAFQTKMRRRAIGICFLV